MLKEYLIESLQDAESPAELLTHLSDQLRVNRTKKFGNGPVQKNINFIIQKLTDDFNMTDDQIKKALEELRNPRL